MPLSLPPILAHRAGSATLFRIYRGSPIDPQTWVQLSPSVQAAWLVYRGYAEVRSAGRTIRAEAGQGFLIGLTPREQFFSADAEILSLNFLWTDDNGRPVLPLPEPRIFPLGEHAKLVESSELLLAAAEERVGNPTVLTPARTMAYGDYQHLKGWFHLWLAELFGVAERLGFPIISVTPMDPRLRRARAFLDEVPLNRALDHVELARTSGISRAQLERLFRQHFHTTPHAYFERRRAEYACHALLGGGVPIKEISVFLGFRHLSRFSAWFSAREHHSPRAYRKLVYDFP
jgi:AraC-like DNA-binding protein